MPRLEYGPSYPPSKDLPLGRESEQDVNVPGSPYFGHLPRASDLPSETWRNMIETPNVQQVVPRWYFHPPDTQLQTLGRILRGLIGKEDTSDWPKVQKPPPGPDYEGQKK